MLQNIIQLFREHDIIPILIKLIGGLGIFFTVLTLWENLLRP